MAAAIAPTRRALLASALVLVVTGALLGGAAWLRWLPCLRERDSLACARVEDHRFDFAVVSAPFEAVSGGVLLAAGANALMLVFWLGWWRILDGSRVARIACLVAAAAAAFVAGGQLIAALSAGAFGVLAPVPALVAQLVVYLAPVLAGVAVLTHVPGIRWAWLLVVAIMLIAGNTLVEYAVLQSIDGSYDSPPGTGVFPAVGATLAGLAFAAASARVDRARPR